ncbi:MAG: aldehyde dehydrogenase family protein [Propionibacteriaceae bacterium]|jgi:succinate-semialdehyde dehydrogenase/glutarate-semialdehyde dehydrogenase|nr:aldehyde dehydrogenase family protein [Propionibacteriaceae bacterium]
MTDWQYLGEFANVSPEREPLEVTSPIDGSLIGKVPCGTPDDIRVAVGRARAAQPGWAATGPWQRADVLARFAKLVYERREELLDLVHAENGKSRIHALEELLGVILDAGYYAANAPKHLKASRRRGAIPFLTSTRVHYQPKGVVGMICPWNYPLTLTASDLLTALAAGNAVVLKPDSLTPFTALFSAMLLREAGLPPDVLQVVPGPGKELGTPLIEGCDHLMFTGSAATGKKVAAQCAALLKSCSAELGGKNPMIVLDDADVERAADTAMTACFSTAGQLCISIERVYVQEPVYERFALALVERAKKLKLGGGDGWDVDLGPLISKAQLDKVSGHVRDAVKKGAKVLLGGQPREDLGPLFFEPTILEGVDERMKVYAEETFGPVVSLYKFSDDAQAVRLANDSEYGLNASVFSSDTARARRIAKQLRAGSVNINEGYAATFGSPDAPMGGMGISGLGRRHGPEGVRGFTEPQTIAVQRALPIAPPPGVSRELYAELMAWATQYLYLNPARLLRDFGVADAAPSALPRPKNPMRARLELPKSLSQYTQSGVPLAGSRVLITGGGSGMGRLMALGAAARGAAVTVWDLTAERAQAVAEEIAARGGQSQWSALDVTDTEAVERQAAQTGEIDIIIHSAGVVGGRALTEEPVSAVNRTIDVNLKSLFWVTKAFLPGMVARDRGFVVTMASASGLLAGAKMSDYAASKFGAIGFSEALRNDMRVAGARVGSLVAAPFYVKTGMFEGVQSKVPLLLPLLEPEAVAEAVLAGIEKGKRRIIMPWFVHTITLLRLLPAGMLDYIADFFGINASMSDFSGRAGDRV